VTVDLSANSYGKSDVRLTKVIRNGSRHDLLEFSVDIQLTGDFASSYRLGDNAKIIATDSMTNTVYVLAKERDFNSPEEFAVILAEHFTQTYEQVTTSTVCARQTTWNRVLVDNKPHDHAFVSGGGELQTASAKSTRGGQTTVTGGIADLLVLKTTNSAFKGFVADRYRTLKDADDRIFATSVTAAWDYAKFRKPFSSAHQPIRKAMLDVFATHMSFAVQETMYEMGKAALAAAPEISRITLRLPNKHRIPVNLQPFGLENNNEIFVWTDEPYGDIRATIERE
jgi:urate oxidase